MSGRLQKIALKLDRFLSKDLTADDYDKLDKMLDEQGLPPSKRPRNLQEIPPSRLNTAMEHVKRHKGKYGLGAAALLGAALLSRRSSQPDMSQMQLPPDQSGF